ncbi:MAG: hypothetical protein ACLQCB_00610 [Spirochaetia bacterium]
MAETFLAAAAVGLLAAVLIPWGDEAQKSAPEPSNAQVSVSTSNAHVQPNPASPVVILSMFVGRSSSRASAPAQAPAPVAKKPVDAPWLSYLGFYSGVPGKPYYLFKDTRAGRVIKVADGVVTDGWSLVETGDKRVVVRNNDDIYIVRMR